MAQKLAQLNAKIMGKATALEEVVTDLYKRVQKPALFQGYTRTYTPYQTEGDGRADQSPAETQMVQARVREVLGEARKAWSELIDGVYSQDQGNTLAKSDIVVDGVTLVKDVPVTTLMYLKKKWTDIHTFLKHLPTPTQEIVWAYDANQGLLRSKEPQSVQKTKKVPQVLVKFQPTDKHPGQADVYTEDKAIGEYTKTEFSGGVPADVKAQLVELSQKVVDAIKVAHEGANVVTDAPDRRIANMLFDFVFAPLTAAK